MAGTGAGRGDGGVAAPRRSRSRRPKPGMASRAPPPARMASTATKTTCDGPTTPRRPPVPGPAAEPLPRCRRAVPPPSLLAAAEPALAAARPAACTLPPVPPPVPPPPAGRSLMAPRPLLGRGRLPKGSARPGFSGRPGKAGSKRGGRVIGRVSGRPRMLVAPTRPRAASAGRRPHRISPVTSY